MFFVSFLGQFIAGRPFYMKTLPRNIDINTRTCRTTRKYINLTFDVVVQVPSGGLKIHFNVDPISPPVQLFIISTVKT